MSLNSLVYVSSCAFGNDPNDIELTHAPSTPNACPPCDVDIIGEDDDNMIRFLNNCLDNLEANAYFYPSMKQQGLPTTPPLVMFGYIHPKTKVEPKFPTIGKSSSSRKPNTQPFYDIKVTNTPVNLEETYGKCFTILSKQGCDTTSEHAIHQVLEKIPMNEKTKGIEYQDPPHNRNPPREYLRL